MDVVFKEAFSCVIEDSVGKSIGAKMSVGLLKYAPAN
jgi:hypothetical protein